MKKTLLQILLISIFSVYSAQDFTIEKINEFAFAQTFNTMEETLIIEYPYLYALTSHGLEIYEIIDNGSLERLSILPITFPRRFELKENFIYLTSALSYMYDLFLPTLYQIDVTDKENPFICNEIEFDEPAITYLIPVIFGNYLILGNFHMEDRIYLLPELEFVATILDTLIALHKITDYIGIDHVSISLMNIYDVSNLTNMQLIGTIDMSPIHGGFVTRYFEMLNDTILIAGGQTAVSFWDITDNANWEYISHYETEDSMIYGKNFTIMDSHLILSLFYGLELIDISDIYNPQFEDHIVSYSYVKASVSYNENLYVATRYDGIQRYQVANGEFDFIENIFDYPYFYSGYIYLNHLFIQTYRYGLLLFDISNPNEPIEIQTILSNPDYKVLQGYENKLIIKDWSNCSYKIFDISDPLDPILTNTIFIGDWMQISLSYLRFDAAEPNVVYFFTKHPNTIIRKYDISEPGNTVLLFEYTELDGDSFFVKNGFGYLLDDINNYQNLYIIAGLYENEPFLINTIEHFSDYQYSPYIKTCGYYLCLNYISEYKETKFYTLNNPLEPEYAFELEVPSSSGWSVLYNDFLFTNTNVSSYIYDISGNPSGILQPIDYIHGLTYIYSMGFYETSETKYLFTIEESDVGVFEFSYNVSVFEEILNTDTITLSNFPNPFNPSTTISFNLTAENAEHAEISIYNIKGQKLKTFPNLQINKSSNQQIIWDGKDDNNQPVSSGVYLYKLKVNGKTLASRKCILLK